VEFYRASGHPAHRTLARIIGDGVEVAITEPVVMEILAGVPGSRLREVRGELMAFRMLPLEGLADFEHAASVYRHCRDRGETVRNQIDCLISVVALRAGASILHNDIDFDVIARHSPLRIEPATG